MVSSVPPVTSHYSNATSGSTKVASAQSQTARQAQVSASRPAQDTLKLSIASQVLAMKQTGATIIQIAAKLNLSISEVDEELGITASTSATQASVLSALSANAK